MQTELQRLIDRLYHTLDSETLFSKVKEGSWQTFFHHSTSVAVLAYKLGKILKGNATNILKLSIREIEERLGVTYEKLLFLSGVAHDYVKVYGGGEKGRNKLEKLLREFQDEESSELTGIIEALARTAEAPYTPELDENLISTVSVVLRIADMLMSLNSVDEALAYIESSKDVNKLREYGIRFGFIKSPSLTILRIKISERIVNLLENRGWFPLVMYHDGLLLAGGLDPKVVPFDELYKAVIEEVSAIFDVDGFLTDIINKLKEKELFRLYQLLEQANEPLQDIGTSEDERELYQYHAIITEYLKGNLRQAVALFKRLEKTIDPRKMATGLRDKGSTYFADELRKVIATPEKIAEFIATKTDKAERFLLLAYMMAYPSEKPLAAESLRPLVGDLPRNRELLRIFSIAQAYKLSKSDADKVKVEVSRLLKREPFTKAFAVGTNIEFYVKRYLTQSLESNVISEPPSESLSVKAYTYCRICGTPMVDEGLRFIEYARDPKVRGGVSELWLPDDVPMGDLEGIAREVRHICPLCFYEASQLRERYTPPFFVLALHPAVAYDLWLWIETRIGNLAEIAPRVKEKTKDFARLLTSIVSSRNTDEDLKDYGKLDWRSGEVRKLIEELLGDLKRVSKRTPLVLFDKLGARLIVSTGGSYAIKRRDVALLISLAPLFISVAGGGQIGIVAALADSYNLGIGQAPVYVPHPVIFVDSIVRPFEEIRVHAKRKGRDLRVEEYAIYNKSYLAVLLALYVYGLKVLSWWKAKRRAEIEDYAHELLTYMSSIPYVPIALSAPPTPSLDPRDDPGEPLPNYVEITLLSRRVEELMTQTSELIEGRRSIPLDRVLWEYAKNLAELNRELSKTAVQKPLRRAIESLLQYADTLGEEVAKNIVADIFLQQVASTAEVNIDEKAKKVEDKEVSYRLVMFSTFKRLADAILEFRRELHPQHLRKLIEVLLDSAYEKYKQAKSQVKD